MSWNREHIDEVAIRSSSADHAAFEVVGLSEIDGARVLDVGCFDGFNTVLKFSPYSNIAEVVGIDPDGSAIDMAKRSAEDDRFTWICCSLDEYFEEHVRSASKAGSGDAVADRGLFDIVYLSHTFQHLADKSEALRKIHSLLKDGGSIILKTVDDSMKVSSPDPDGVMRNVFSCYEAYVKRETGHTRFTDRYCGSKVHSLLVDAGFQPMRTMVFHSNTTGMSLEDRKRLFEQMVYFRRNMPDSAPVEVRDHMMRLLDRWKSMFEDEAYFFDTSTIMSVAQKPPIAQCDKAFIPLGTAKGNGFSIIPMRESDLGEVMFIETRSFPDPWTPLAFAMELRHNHDAHYMVARDDAGHLIGYIGWWRMPFAGCITHVAVHPAYRRGGYGKALVEHAVSLARLAGAEQMRLLVRDSNSQARDFYKALGFFETGIEQDYYSNPTEDGVSMALFLTSDSNEDV